MMHVAPGIGSDRSPALRVMRGAACCAALVLTLPAVLPAAGAPPAAVKQISDKAQLGAAERAADPAKFEPRREVKTAAARANAKVLAGNAVVVNNGGNPPTAKQLKGQLRPVLANELRFVRAYANPAPAHRAQIKAAAEACLEAFAHEHGVAPPDPAALDAQVNNVAFTFNPALSDELKTSLRLALAAELKRVLTAEQVADYESELAARDARRREAALSTFLALLDRQLRLSSDQREKIAATLKEHWQDDWNGWWMLAQYNDRFFPAMPEQYVTDALDDNQRTAWRNTQKISLRDNTVFNGRVGGVPGIDDPWWNAEPDSAVTDPAASADKP